MHARARAKSTPIYNYIDETRGYYNTNIEPKYRSRINISFRIGSKNEELEKKFAEEVEAKGLIGLQGHPAVGGCRIGLNNSVPFEAVYALISFMKAFKNSNAQ